MVRSRASKNDTQPAAVRIRSYLASVPPDTRRALRRIRSIVRSVAPDAVEHFSYGIPGFKLEGKPLVWYAGFARHTSLYPIGASIRRACAADLEGYETSTGTVRFPLAAPVPSALVKRLVKARLGELRKESLGGR